MTSLVLARDGVEVASVSDYVAARALADLGKVKVEGHVDNAALVEKGHVTLTWAYPGAAQGGEYTCAVHAIDHVGRDVTFVKSVHVDVMDPSIGDLVNTVHDMQLREDRLDTESKEQQNQIANLQSQLDESRHIEKGSVDFGSSHQWKDGKSANKDDGYRYTYRDSSVKFSSIYKASPIVHIGLDDAWMHRDYNTYYFVDLLSVDVSSFTIRCSIRDFSDHYIDLRLNWLSLPSSL